MFCPDPFENVDETVIDTEDHDNVSHNNLDEIKASMALFILKTADKHSIPLSTMEIIIADTSSLIANAVSKVEDELLKNGVDAQLANNICSQEAIKNPFSGLETVYLQTKYFRDKMGMIVSMLYACMASCVHR